MNRLSLAVSALVAVSAALTACGGGNPDPAAPESAASAEASAASVSPTAEPTAPTATPSAVAETTPPPAPAPEPAADLTISPMKMSFGKKDGKLELKSDGTVWGSKGGKSSQIASITKNALTTADGSFVIAVWKDNSVTAGDAKLKATFDNKDTLVMPDGAKMSVDDHGKVDLVKADGTKEKSLPTITGFKPAARRTAMVVLVLALLAPREVTVSGPASVSPPKEH